MEDIKRPTRNPQNTQPSPAVNDIASAPTESPVQNQAPQAQEPVQQTANPNMQPQEEGGQSPQVAMPPAKHPKKKGVVIAIVAAILVAILLIVTAVFIYLQSREDDNGQITETTESTAVESDDGRVDANDVEQAINEITQEMNALDDSGDFGQNDLTNSEIGL